MAETTGLSNSGQGKHRLRRGRKMAPRVDLTPMVDLAFLLITFFMLSTQLARPGALEWQKRVKDDSIQEPVSECCVLNILIDSANQVYTYEGADMQSIRITSFGGDNGLQKIMMEKKKKIKAECGNYSSGQSRQMQCLIKLLSGACYQNLTDVIDEMNIVHVAYSIQDPLPEELAQLKIKANGLAANQKLSP